MDTARYMAGGVVEVSVASYEWSVVGYGKAIIPIGTESGYDASVAFSSGTLLDTIAEGDLVIVAMVCDGTPPQLIPENYTSRFESGDALPRCSVATKFMTSSPDTGFTVSHDDTYKQPVLWLIVRGADLTTPLDVAIQTAAFNPGNPNPPSITPTSDGCMIVVLGFVDDQDKEDEATFPSGYTNTMAAGTGDDAVSGGSTAMIATKIQTTAAEEDPATFTTTAPGEDAWSVSMALRLRTS